MIDIIKEKYNFQQLINFFNSIFGVNPQNKYYKNLIFNVITKYLDENLSENEKLDLLNIYNNNKELIEKFKNQILPQIYDIYEYWILKYKTNQEKEQNDILDVFNLYFKNEQKSIKNDKKKTNILKKIFNKIFKKNKN